MKKYIDDIVGFLILMMLLPAFLTRKKDGHAISLWNR